MFYTMFFGAVITGWTFLRIVGGERMRRIRDAEILAEIEAKRIPSPDAPGSGQPPKPATKSAPKPAAKPAAKAPPATPTKKPAKAKGKA